MNSDHSKILVVEDEPVSLHVAVEYLQEAGFSVEQAKDGKEALQKLLAYPHQFSVVVMDRIMPYMSGMELVNIMKKSPDLDKIPIIMLTSLGEKEDIIDVIEASVFDYLIKPIAKDLLVKLVKQAIQTFNRTAILAH